MMGQKVGQEVKLKEKLVYNLEAAIFASAVWNVFINDIQVMFVYGSHGQIEGKSC